MSPLYFLFNLVIGHYSLICMGYTHKTVSMERDVRHTIEVFFFVPACFALLTYWWQLIVVVLYREDLHFNTCA